MAILNIGSTFFKRWVAVLFVSLFAAAGFYIIFVTSALMPWEGASFHLDGYERDPNDRQLTNSTYNTSVRGQVENRSTTGPSKLVFVFFSDQARVRYLDYTCGSTLNCSPGRYTGFQRNASELMDQRLDSLNLCIDVPPGFRHTSRQDIARLRYEVFDTSRPFWVDYDFATGPGTCADQSNLEFIGAHGSCMNMVNGAGCSGSGGFGEGYGNSGRGGSSGGGEDTSNTNTPSSGTQTTNNPSKGQGGGGGSTATKQSNNPSSLPGSADQGTKSEQPQVDPSPFYDGKTYAPGSDSDPLFARVTNRIKDEPFQAGSYLVLTVILVAAAASYYSTRARKPIAKRK